MQLSALKKFYQIWAKQNSSGTNNIPDAQAGTGMASWSNGFPPETMKPYVQGGVPPLGEDMNGVLQALSEGAVRASCSVIDNFDPIFQTNIGGYPINSTVQDGSNNIYLSLVDNNNYPLSDSAAWFSLNGSLIAYISAETSRAENAETALQNEINALNNKKLGLGITGENWQHVGKSAYVQYTNPYSYPIAVSIVFGTSNDQSWDFYINGINVSHIQEHQDFNGAWVGGIVPPGATYQFNGNYISSWSELF